MSRSGGIEMGACASKGLEEGGKLLRKILSTETSDNRRCSAELCSPHRFKPNLLLRFLLFSPNHTKFNIAIPVLRLGQSEKGAEAATDGDSAQSSAYPANSFHEASARDSPAPWNAYVTCSMFSAFGLATSRLLSLALGRASTTFWIDDSPAKVVSRYSPSPSLHRSQASFGQSCASWEGKYKIGIACCLE